MMLAVHCFKHYTRHIHRYRDKRVLINFTSCKLAKQQMTFKDMQCRIS